MSIDPNNMSSKQFQKNVKNSIGPKMGKLAGCDDYTRQNLYVGEKALICKGELFEGTIMALQFATLENLSEAIRNYPEIGELKFELHTLEKPCIDFNSSTWFSELKHFVICVFYMMFWYPIMRQKSIYIVVHILNIMKKSEADRSSVERQFIKDCIFYNIINEI